MNIEQFLNMGDGDTMTWQQASQLNLVLSKTSVTSIPFEKGRQIADYLATALNMNSVEPQLTLTLEALLAALQHRRNLEQKNS